MEDHTREMTCPHFRVFSLSLSLRKGSLKEPPSGVPENCQVKRACPPEILLCQGHLEVSYQRHHYPLGGQLLEQEQPVFLYQPIMDKLFLLI